MQLLGTNSCRLWLQVDASCELLSSQLDLCQAHLPGEHRLNLFLSGLVEGRLQARQSKTLAVVIHGGAGVCATSLPVSCTPLNQQ